MPSFYPMPRQLPPTPPEFVPQYGNHCAGHQYQPQTYQAPVPSQHIGRPEESRYDYAHRYGQSASVAAPTVVSYQQSNGFNPAPSMPQSNRYYDSMQGAPILPPMRTYDPAAYAPPAQRPQELPAKEEKPTGGVSATLDYDMETMTDFVADMTKRIMSLGLKPVEPPYRKWVHSVLTATRLPSATILLGMHFLATHMRIKAQNAPYRSADEDIHRAVTVALILGSKFLDDNTFINRSWAEVSYISVHTLNRLEMQWLEEIDFQLHQVSKDPEGWPVWEKRWKQYVKDKSPAIPGLVKPGKVYGLIPPIDTNVQRSTQRQDFFSPRSAAPTAPPPRLISGTVPMPEYSNKPATSHYPPAYSQYDAWGAPRSSVDISPRSAPHTGPTTPEYYGGSNIWAPPEGYNRRSMFGFQPQSHAQPHYAIPPPPYTQTPITPMHPQTNWSGHGLNCVCFVCRRGSNHFGAPQFAAPQAVVG